MGVTFLLDVSSGNLRRSTQVSSSECVHVSGSVMSHSLRNNDFSSLQIVLCSFLLDQHQPKESNPVSRRVKISQPV